MTKVSIECCPPFCVFLLRLHNFYSITCRFRFSLFLYTKSKNVSITCIAFMPHFSGVKGTLPFFPQLYTHINTTTNHPACPSTFSAIIQFRLIHFFLSLSFPPFIAEIFILWSALIAQFLSWVDQNVLNVTSSFSPSSSSLFLLHSNTLTTSWSKMYKFHIYDIGQRRGRQIVNTKKRQPDVFILLPNAKASDRSASSTALTSSKIYTSNCVCFIKQKFFRTGLVDAEHFEGNLGDSR